MNLVGERMHTEPLKALVKDMHQGINTVTEKVEYISEGIPIIQSKHITQGYLNLDETKYLSSDAYSKYKEKYQPKVDDLLVCNIGTIGKSLRITDENHFLIAWNLFLIKIKKERLYSSFFAHYLNYLADKKYFDRFLTGGTVKFINKKTMGNIPIPLPPLDTQKKIAAILDEADKLRQLDKKLIEKYDALTQSLFLDMFGDPVTNPKGWQLFNFSDMLEIRNGKNQKAVENVNGKYPIYGSGGIMSYANNYISEANSVIIGRKGNINKPILVKEKYWHVDTAFGLNPIISKLTHDYLYWFCVRYNFEQHNKTVTIPSLTKETLLRIKIPIPPIELQNQFAERVQAIEAQKAQAQQSLQKSEELFNSLLQKAFKGELI
jgi:type I restriction enzyme, S subunit